MTLLRRRMIEDMRVRNYSPRTVEAYVAAVAKLAKHFGRSPDRLGAQEVRAFQVQLLTQQTSWPQFNQIVAGLRFFFGTTLLRPGMVEMLPCRYPLLHASHQERRIPKRAWTHRNGQSGIASRTILPPRVRGARRGPKSRWRPTPCIRTCPTACEKSLTGGVRAD